MDIPAPFQSTISHIKQLGYEVEQVSWSDEKTKRNLILQLTARKRFPAELRCYVCKMALINQIDKDDLEPIQNYRRAIWFQEVLEALTLKKRELPFSVPKVSKTNAHEELGGDGVVWMIMDHTIKEMMCPDLPLKNGDSGRQSAQFQNWCRCL